ncbi:MAG: hypothetical protein AB1481_04345 [Candidatus Omnitrophota bacterium]
MFKGRFSLSLKLIQRAVPVFLLLILLGCNSANQYAKEWGIAVEGARLSAGGYMVDFRYRILDPDKAEKITGPKVKPYIIDQASGAKFIVPTPPKVGSLKQSSRGGKPKLGKTYFMIFANPGQYIKAGNKITVVAGDFQAKDIVVQ